MPHGHFTKGQSRLNGSVVPQGAIMSVLSAIIPQIYMFRDTVLMDYVMQEDLSTSGL